MRKPALFLFMLVILTIGALIPRCVVMAEEEKPSDPVVSLTIQLQKTELRINEPVLGTISIANTSEFSVDEATLELILPDSVILYQQDCSTLFTMDDLVAISIPAKTVTSWNVCYKLDAKNAQSGTFNFLYSLTYTWGERSAQAVVEKPVKIDLIGVENILGIPLAFAGFVLPGLMGLIVLKWFKVQWAVDLSTQEQVIYGIVISLLLLGPFTWWANQPGAGSWLNLFNLYEQVNFSTLALYTGIGLFLGFVVGMVYKIRANKKAKLQVGIKNSDSFGTVIRKSLILNQAYSRKGVYLESLDKKTRYIGAHYVETATQFLVLPQFRFTVSTIKKKQVKDRLEKEIARLGGDLKEISSNPEKIIKLLEKLGDEQNEAIVISNPVEIYSFDTMKYQTLPYLACFPLEVEKYRPGNTNEEKLLIEVVN